MSQWEPASPAQRDFLTSNAQILCGGGSAGTYKTESLLVDAVTEYDNPRMNAVLFRTTFPELEGKIIPRSKEIYSEMGSTYNSTSHTWAWPWGSKVKFAYLQHDDDVFAHQGAEYSWEGYDESTHRSEFQIRYMLSRLRSTDSSLFCRARLGTNPGGPGHSLHSHVFLGDSCPHCEVSIRKPGIIYKDATWLSDDKAIGMTTQYIFSRWDPNGLLPEYGKQLIMQGGAFAKQLLDGCWKSFEGQYFDCWSYDSMTMPIQKIPQEYWQSWWVGADYGFSGSASAAVLLTRAPDGVIYLVAEYPVSKIRGGPRENVKSFANSVFEGFAKKDLGQEFPRRIEAMYLGPDSWNNRGDDHTLAGQMNELLEPYGLEFIRANNDRAGGAQLLYNMLQSGQLIISRSCKNSIAAIESRLHDEKEPVKIMKVPSDPLDDVIDAIRYGVYSYIEQNRKPARERIKERLRAIVETDDPMRLTSAMINYQRIVKAEEAEDSEDPVYVGGNARRRMNRATDKHT